MRDDLRLAFTPIKRGVSDIGKGLIEKGRVAFC